VDAAMMLTQQADAYKKQHEELFKKLSTSERSMTVCDICGVFINSTDNDERRWVRSAACLLTAPIRDASSCKGFACVAMFYPGEIPCCMWASLAVLCPSTHRHSHACSSTSRMGEGKASPSCDMPSLHGVPARHCMACNPWHCMAPKCWPPQVGAYPDARRCMALHLSPDRAARFLSLFW
jgi:hypothetical protein